jgi:hypothetical protein
MQDLVRLAEQREAAAKAEIATLLPSKAAAFIEQEQEQEQAEGAEEQQAEGAGEQGDDAAAGSSEQAPASPTMPAPRVRPQRLPARPARAWARHPCLPGGPPACWPAADPGPPPCPAPPAARQRQQPAVPRQRRGQARRGAGCQVRQAALGGRRRGAGPAGAAAEADGGAAGARLAGWPAGRQSGRQLQLTACPARRRQPLWPTAQEVQPDGPAAGGASKTGGGDTRRSKDSAATGGAQGGGRDVRSPVAGSARPGARGSEGGRGAQAAAALGRNRSLNGAHAAASGRLSPGGLHTQFETASEGGRRRRRLLSAMLLAQRSAALTPMNCLAADAAIAPSHAPRCPARAGAGSTDEVGGGTGLIGSLRSAADGEEPALPSLGEVLASVSERLARLQASTAAADVPSPTGGPPPLLAVAAPLACHLVWLPRHVGTAVSERPAL